MLYCYPSYDRWGYFSIKVSPEHLQRTLASITQAYKDIFPGNPCDYFFLNEYFNKQYQGEQRFGGGWDQGDNPHGEGSSMAGGG